MDSCFEAFSYRQPGVSAPAALRRAVCCAALAALAASCVVHENTGQAGTDASEAPARSSAYHLYVGPNGDDRNRGTETSPFRTIERAAREAQPDSTAHVAPGSYPGGFMTTANGTPKGRVVYLSTLRWGAKIVPPLDSVNTTAWDNRGNYVDIIGFDVNGTVYQGGVKWANGIYSGGSYDAIRANHVHHIATSAACADPGGSGIGIDSYYHGIKSEVTGNHVHDIGPAGCRFIQGITMNSPGKVANNVVYRVAEAGILLWRDATNVVVANNTVAASNSGIVIGAGDFYYSSGPNDHTHVSNNIVYDNRRGIAELGATGANNTYVANLVFSNEGLDWSLANGLAHKASVAAAPQFLDYNRTGTPDFRLSGTSPAIGKGIAAHAPPSDFKGAPRNELTGIDIGAYQH
jgi:hypothetical protein